MGLRFRKNFKELPGKPDVAFPRQRVAVFCDGDFWHGKEWKRRKRKLQKGANAAYWVPKIEANITRDKAHNAELRRRGWIVLRFWESDILADVNRVAEQVAQVVRASM